MTIPAQSNYPTALDTDDNLFQVHDSLRMRLVQDYNPGDKTIFVEGDPVIFRRFPATGLVTLTDQCDDIDHRALSFYYSAIDYANMTIGNLELLDEFAGLDMVKAKRITNVTQNVMAKHHDIVKDAVIAIEEFIGIKGTTDTAPLGETLEGRINFLRKLVLTPRAYFEVDRTIGLVPLTVTFKDLSFRLGTDSAPDEDPIEYLWDFGDNTVSVISSTISVTSNVTPSCINNVFVNDLDGGTITKTYCNPGVFDATLTVTNKFGSDTITIPALINARIGAPEDAIVEYFPGPTQVVLAGTGVFDGTTGEYTPPVIRTPINTLITMRIPSGENPHNLGYTYAGELLNGSGSPIDPINSYTWALSDDLNHPTLNSSTKASYSIGGLYDMKLRADTTFGAYRITTYENSIDVVEPQNLWLFNYQANSTTSVVGYEYGLISETFKTLPTTTFSPGANASFLSSLPNTAQMTREFKRNTGFVPSSNVNSGGQGNALLFYASGRAAADPISSETIKFVSYNGFANTFDGTIPGFTRPWNWANFNSNTTAYFAFGTPTTAAAANTSPSNPALTQYNIISGATTTTTLTSSQFSNGADELLTNPSLFDGMGTNTYGNFSVYRTAFKNNTGYILRNDNVGSFFRIRSFYRTNGTLGNPVQTITKLADMPGPTKLEGELLPMTPGLFFFNNSGSISAYNDTASVWETGGPGINSITFRSLQDQTVANFDDVSQTLLAASNGDKRAYLSYDYSVAAFIKFDAASNTFSSLTSRPPGTQWIMGIY